MAKVAERKPTIEELPLCERERCSYNWSRRCVCEDEQRSPLQYEHVGKYDLRIVAGMEGCPTCKIPRSDFARYLHAVDVTTCDGCGTMLIVMSAIHDRQQAGECKLFCALCVRTGRNER